MRGRAAPPHPGIYRVPPAPGATVRINEVLSELCSYSQKTPLIRLKNNYYRNRRGH